MLPSIETGGTTPHGLASGMWGRVGRWRFIGFRQVLVVRMSEIEDLCILQGCSTVLEPTLQWRANYSPLGSNENKNKVSNDARHLGDGKSRGFP